MWIFHLKSSSSSPNVWHVPPFLQGSLTQALVTVSQFLPCTWKQMHECFTSVCQRSHWSQVLYAHLKTLGAAAPVSVRLIRLAAAVVQTGAGHARVTLRQYRSVHFTCTHGHTQSLTYQYYKNESECVSLRAKTGRRALLRYKGQTLCNTKIVI